MAKKQKINQEGHGFKEKMADSLGSAREVILDMPRLVFIGNRELTVENYKSIGEYSSDEIVLAANPCSLRIRGADLEIRSIASELIYICGKIYSVEFKKEV